MLFSSLSKRIKLVSRYIHVVRGRVQVSFSTLSTGRACGLVHVPREPGSRKHIPVTFVISRSTSQKMKWENAQLRPWLWTEVAAAAAASLKA